MNSKDRIGILNGVLKRLHYIHYQHLKNYIHNGSTEDRVRLECRIMYKKIKWGKSFELIHEKIKLFNIIFLRRYEQGIQYQNQD